jgi:hypothetical protein
LIRIDPEADLILSTEIASPALMRAYVARYGEMIVIAQRFDSSEDFAFRQERGAVQAGYLSRDTQNRPR